MDSPHVSLHRIRPERNERRFYRLDIVVDLFGTTLLCRHWGRIGTDGRLRQDPFADQATAVLALVAHATRKRRRGYRDMSSPLSEVPSPPR